MATGDYFGQQSIPTPVYKPLGGDADIDHIVFLQGLQILYQAGLARQKPASKLGAFLVHEDAPNGEKM